MPSRYVCEVLDEMRAQLKVLDKVNMGRYISITSLMIEEVQTMVNRMEASLWGQHEVKSLREEKKKLQAEIKKLEAKKDESREG